MNNTEILDPEEKRRLLFDFNKTDVPYPGDKTIHELFEEQVERTPDHIAFVEWPLKITYGELNEKSNAFAHTLKQNGVGPDTIVAILVERSIEMYVGILGILKSGGGYLPIPPEYPEERKQFLLTDSRARILLSKAKNKIKIIRLIPKKQCASTQRSTSSNLAYIMYASGSLGIPKGVLVEHRSLVNLCNWHIRNFNVTSRDQATQYVSSGFDASVWEVFPYLIRGATIHIIDKKIKSNIEALLGYFENHHITIGFLPTRVCEQMMEKGSGNRKLSLRKLLTGGDKLNGYNPQKYHIYNHYGPIENTVITTSFKANDSCLNMPIGKPIDNTRVYILDTNFQPLPIGVTGELYISGAGIARGYLNQPELTAEKFGVLDCQGRRPLPKLLFNHFSSLTRNTNTNTIYKTGDLARWLPNGTIEFIGRVDHQVRIKGYRIEPEEVRRRLLKQPNIKDAIVTTVESKTGDKYLCAYIIPSPPHRPIDIPQLKNELSTYLPSFMTPTFFILIEKIPLTSNREIDWKALPAPEIGEGKTHDIQIAPRNKVEEILSVIWSEILRVDKNTIGIDSNFFELGGHSLNVTLMLLQVHKELSVKIPFEEVFITPSIRGLSRYIEGAYKEYLPPIDPVEEKGFYPLSFVQKRFYSLHQSDPKNAYCNIPYVIALEGNLDIGRMDGAFRMLVRRHESFRTSIQVIDYMPMQEVQREVPFVVEYFEMMESDMNSFQNSPFTVKTIINNFIRPFNLSRAPLLRVGIIKTAEKKYILIVDSHQIISDRFSMSIFIREFIQIYEGEKLSPLRSHYKDFTKWQIRERKRWVFIKLEEYWLRQFEEMAPKLKLPIDFPAPQELNFEGNHFPFEIEKDLTLKIRDSVIRTRTTLNQFLLAVFYIFLSRICNENDIVVGCPVSGRTHPDLRQVIGVFVNMLAMRNRPEGYKTFRRFLEEVKQTTFDAYENQDYPLEELALKMRLKEEYGENPLFDTVFVLNTYDNRYFEGNTLKATPIDIESKVSVFDITLHAYENRETISMIFEYKTTLFRPDTIEKYSQCYTTILEQVVENIDIQLKDTGNVGERK